MADRLREILATVFYVGYLPLMPGTWASAASMALFVIAGRPLGAWSWAALGGMALLSVFALSRTEQVFGAKDPGPVVLDEVAGMWLTILIGGSSGWLFLGLAFVFFRVFDMLKPFPIGRLERLPGWLGVLADDLGAAAVAGILVRLVLVYVTA